jgi:hypothetical protein
MVLKNARLDEIALDPPDAGISSFLVLLHQAAAAGDVAGDDRSKMLWRRAVRQLAALSRLWLVDIAHV